MADEKGEIPRDINIALPEPGEVREFVQRILSGDQTARTPDANFFDPDSCRPYGGRQPKHANYLRMDDPAILLPLSALLPGEEGR